MPEGIHYPNTKPSSEAPMTKPINFSNVNISLKQFQDISSGQYNAGEVRLTGQNSLGKINHHVTLKSRNNVSLAHEEVLAVKEAFVKALAGGGVGIMELNKVRAQLGLAPTSTTDTGLKERSVKPLSRQAIREILDRNAEAINATQRENVIQTSDEIYADVSAEEKRMRKTEREAVNRSLTMSRETERHDQIDIFQAVVSGDIGFRNTEERAAILKFAEEQYAALMRRCNGHPSEERTSDVVLSSNSGHKIVMGTGMSDAAYIRKLDEIIFQIKDAPYGLRNDIMEIRQEFRTLGSEAAFHAWLDGLADDPQGGLKARTVAVMLMVDRGVNDYETLSLPNRLDDDQAIAFVTNIITRGNGLSADALRQSPIVRDAAAGADPALHLEEHEKTELPVMSDWDYNKYLKYAFLNEPERLPPGFRALAQDAMLEIHRALGEKGCSEKLTIRSLLRGSAVSEVLSTDNPEAPRVTPESVREAFMAEAKQAAVERFISESVRVRLASRGESTAIAYHMVADISARLPQLVERLNATESPEQAEAIFGEYTVEIDKACDLRLECVKAQEKLGEWFRAALADKLGVPVEAIADKAWPQETLLDLKGEEFVGKICKGKVKATTAEEVETAVRGVAEDYAEKFAAACSKIDTLDMPASAKDVMKTELLNANKVLDIDYDKLVAHARLISTAGLEARFAANASVPEILGELRDICVALSGPVNDLFSEAIAAGKEIGPDETGIASDLLLAVIIGSKPDLAAKVGAFVARPDVQEDTSVLLPQSDFNPSVNFMKFISEEGANARLASNLGKTGLSLPMAQALGRAVKAEGLEGFSAAEAFALFGPKEPAGAMLKAAVESSAEIVTPSSLEAMAREAVRATRERIIARREEAAAVAAAKQEFLEGEGATKALSAGYARGELSTIADVYARYKTATGADATAAIEAALDPQSKARRLCSFGGRFTADAAGFRAGLRLLDSFSAWYATLCADIAAEKKDSPTTLNIDKTTIGPDTEYAVGKFLMEELSVNDAIDIEADDPEKIFGMANNPAMRFVGRNYTMAFANSLAQVPPEKRGLLYAVFDIVDPLMTTENDRAKSHHFELSLVLAARVLHNFDAVANLREKGPFDREHLLGLLFPDFELPPNATNMDVFNTYATVLLSMSQHGAGGADLIRTVPLIMEGSGCTKEEAFAAVEAGKGLPLAPYMSNFNGKLEEMDGTAKGGRKTMIGDIFRPENPKIIAENKVALPAGDCRFVFNFPNGKTLIALPGSKEAKEVMDSAQAIADELEAFCGKIHQAQLSAVYFALSQSGLGPVNMAFTGQGISSNEHMPVTYTLSRDDESGGVTVRYSEPRNFPVKFSWETTIQPDGSSTSTPMVINQ